MSFAHYFRPHSRTSPNANLIGIFAAPGVLAACLAYFPSYQQLYLFKAIFIEPRKLYISSSSQDFPRDLFRRLCNSLMLVKRGEILVTRSVHLQAATMVQHLSLSLATSSTVALIPTCSSPVEKACQNVIRVVSGLRNNHLQILAGFVSSTLDSGPTPPRASRVYSVMEPA
jgi:hypothetical protein